MYKSVRISQMDLIHYNNLNHFPLTNPNPLEQEQRQAQKPFIQGESDSDLSNHFDGFSIRTASGVIISRKIDRTESRSINKRYES